MAPRSSKGKSNRGKGEKKKREEKVLVPSLVDITVTTPYETQVILKGVSTDKIIDVKRLLASHVDTCHFTNYSLSHQVKGHRLSDNIQVVTLKPCVLRMIPVYIIYNYATEDYVEESQALTQVRRVLDIVACTTRFSSVSKASSNKLVAVGNGNPAAVGLDMVAIHPTPKLSQFYEFFSIPNVSPPILRFFAVGKQLSHTHSIVDLLQNVSNAFAKLNNINSSLVFQFGNLPYGLRTNTWLVPPSESLSTFSPLPTEDENWGGNGGGQGRNGEHDLRPWAAEFSVLATLPCKTEEERVIRDKKAFLLHNLFVDASVRRAVRAISDVIGANQRTSGTSDFPAGSILLEDRVGDLSIIVKRDVAGLDQNPKGAFQNEAFPLSSKELSERNLLKGITADESVIVHSGTITIHKRYTFHVSHCRDCINEEFFFQDIWALSTVIVKHCGYTAVVNVKGETKKGMAGLRDIVIDNLPDGGANALNLNSLRVQLHRSHSVGKSGGNQPPQFDLDDLESFRCLVHELVKNNLTKLEEERESSERSIRWELGSCWVQHLQKKETVTEDLCGKPAMNGETDLSVKELPGAIAASLNFMLGLHGLEGSDGISSEESCLRLQWLQKFLSTRFGWIQKDEFKHLNKNNSSLLMLLQVGLELIPRDYDFDSPNPFKSSDVFGLIPVCKALAKMIAVCGPYHKNTACAYSLLAVVLYHTGDFNQVTSVLIFFPNSTFDYQFK
ncbi:hypothetical protein F2Q70_00019984 [Brassica cretica]|uniref:Clu domain-containing protein n=1 Tax=Brassica cretica TaxID=69181 RepID=A0A8S9GMG9_BRACR|nr:hypothetical protein F2Q70_00019984 [Brassica cretica]